MKQSRHFDTNLLKTLDALLAEGNVTRAAERLCVTQPAMSGALRRLRTHFGDPLLVRAGREMILTPLAESLIAPVRETLFQLELTLATRPAFDPGSSRRRFKIAMSDYAASVLMPSVIRRLEDEGPAMACDLQPIRDNSLTQMASAGLDALITISGCELSEAGATQGLKLRMLHDDDFVCLVDGRTLPADGSLTLDEYLRRSHIVARFGAQLETLPEQAWGRAGFDIHVAATASSFATAAFMIRGTGLVATVQRRLAQVLAASLELTIVECPMAVDPLRQIMIWHPRSDHDPAHRYLRKLLVEAGLNRISAPTAEASGIDRTEQFADDWLPIAAE